jgi:hypothetical protein
MGCNTASDEQLARALAGQIEEYDDNKLAEQLRAESLQDRNLQDAELARSLAASGSGVDQALSNMFGQRAGSMAHPASFAEPADDSMIHIACEIGESEVEILVDTGAQMSVISEPLASQLGLLSRLDRSRQGVANGVGQAKILGHVLDVPVKLGHVEFALNFSVLQMQQPMLILGLDQMRHYKCLVDLERRRLVFGGHGGVEVPFLSSVRGTVTSPMDAVLVQSRRAVEMLRGRDPLGARKTLETMGQLLRNIAKHPSDLKYRRLRGGNDRLQREVLAHPEAVELLRLAGFAGDGEDLVLPAGTPLQAVKKLTMIGGLFG